MTCELHRKDQTVGVEEVDEKDLRPTGRRITGQTIVSLLQNGLWKTDTGIFIKVDLKETGVKDVVGNIEAHLSGPSSIKFGDLKITHIP